MGWRNRRNRPPRDGGAARGSIDGVIRRGLTAAADADGPTERPAPQPVEPHEADTGVNPYDTLGPEILNRHRPKGRSIQSQVKTSGSGNPYDTLAERAPKRRCWDDAFIDTVVRRSDR